MSIPATELKTHMPLQHSPERASCQSCLSRRWVLLAEMAVTSAFQHVWAHIAVEEFCSAAESVCGKLRQTELQRQSKLHMLSMHTYLKLLTQVGRRANKRRRKPTRPSAEPRRGLRQQRAAPCPRKRPQLRPLQLWAPAR